MRAILASASLSENDPGEASMIPYVPQPAGNLWVAAIFSMILGGAATIAFHFAALGIRRRFPRADTIAWVVFAILAFSLLIQTRAVDRMFGGYFSYKTPRERLQDHFADFERQVARDPEIRRALEGFPGVSEKLQDMGRRGIPRLDDSTLRRRARIMASLLPLLGDHACACVVRLAPPSESDHAEIERALLKLESRFVREWMEVLYLTILAEARQSPIRAVSSEEAAAAYQSLEAKIGADAGRRLVAGLREGAPDPECCWAAKTIYEVAPTLPEAHAATLLRMLAATF